MSLGDVSGVAKSSILMSSLSFFFFCLAPATLINEQMIITWTCKFQEWSASIDGRLNYNSIYKFLKNGERHHQWTKTNNLLCFKFILLWLFWFALLFCGWLLMLKLNKRNIHKLKQYLQAFLQVLCWAYEKYKRHCKMSVFPSTSTRPMHLNIELNTKKCFSCPPKPRKLLKILHDSKYVKIITVNFGLRNEFGSDLRRNGHYLRSSENKAWKKFRLMGDLWPMTYDLWPLRYRCRALPTDLTSQLRAGHYVGS